jgi:hypothetical protein
VIFFIIYFQQHYLYDYIFHLFVFLII